MRDRGWGRIINTASIAGLSPMKGIPDYSAAKAAIISYTRSLAMEHSSKGVTSNALCPGLVHTEIWETFADQIGPSIGKTRQQIFDAAASQGSAIKRYARPEEIGKVVAFLASEAASYVSGSSIQVDGGSLAGFGIEF
jgi:NAD(P)-dependent dehydrogenase (short-subunit alcohol dehydrogenase family)